MTIMEHVSIKTLYHLLCCMLLFISAMCALAQEYEPVGAQDERLSTLIHQRMQEAKVPALSVSVTIKGVRQRFVYGVADVAGQKANTLDKVYELGSMSKAFTGLVVQILIQEGKLRQGDDIITYLPDMRLNYQGKPVSLTVADFLYHTSGLPFSTLARVETPMPGITVAQQLRDENLLFAPGAKFSYASANYDVLGAVIENLTGKTFTEVIAERLTQPLGMSATVAVKGDEIIVNKASGYKLGFGKPVLFHAPLARNHVPAAYIHSTLPDMEIWIDAWLHRKAVSATLREAMNNSWRGNSDVPLAADNRTLYASGWFIDQNQGPYISHGGQNPNFSSCIALRPEQQIGIVALANMNSNLILQLCADIDNYLRIGKYADGAGDAITATDTLFVYLTLLLCFWGAVVVVRGAFRVYHATAHGPGKKQRLRLRVREYVIALAVPVLVAAVLYVAPGILSPGLDWRFILVWGPSSVLAIPFGIILLAFVLTLNHQIKRILSHNKEWDDE
ncbi:precolibactin peptidase ClbP [Escherichia coli]|uniref:precolibactin peptidase ClbP n=1 Tax=Escherichia coli TaxID=562 RepID=UPI000D1697AE|nr:precolibactin peptidase ClbP [Escherichia coli]EFA4228709.1 precolibactin peptidase ClbP [Escherichia coli O11:H15]EGK4048958.1 precolibactin peptidase ClbP [Escherichia coli]EGK4058563.1 precolibactin peptidase ClbP [Escherichia coli]EII3575550.1 precolibactin peptidase ClbP [Escherichia coli]PSY82636.1 precolibactin peptidase ClbP [Escherichia coli]